MTFGWGEMTGSELTMWQNDSNSVHPRLVCQSCSRYYDQLRSSGHPPESHSFPFVWEPHSEEDENYIHESLSPKYTM